MVSCDFVQKVFGEDRHTQLIAVGQVKGFRNVQVQHLKTTGNRLVDPDFILLFDVFQLESQEEIIIAIRTR